MDVDEYYEDTSWEVVDGEIVHDLGDGYYLWTDREALLEMLRSLDEAEAAEKESEFVRRRRAQLEAEEWEWEYE